MLAQIKAQCYAIGINDVYKAFDCVDTQQLVEMLLISKLRDRRGYVSIIKDYDKCNLCVGQAVIKRTRGLPQGARGSPQLFNFYMSKVLSGTIKHEYVYADNVVFRESNMDSLKKQEKKFSNALNVAGLRFDNESANAAYNSTTLHSKHDTAIPRPKPKEENVVPMDTKRILGYQLKIDKEGVLSMDLDKVREVVKVKTRMLPPYQAMKYFKVCIKPKIAFHYKHIYQIPDLKDLFQSMTCILCLPYAYLVSNKVFDTGTANPWAKYWSVYVMLKKGNIVLPKESDHVRLRRWRILCSLMGSYYISIFKAISFIQFGKVILKNPEDNLTLQQFKNNAKTLDFLWFALMRKYQLSKTLLLMEELYLKRITKSNRQSMRKMKKRLPNFDEMLSNINRFKKR